MARVNVDNWIREEHGGAVIQRVSATSAVEALARREPMGTDTKTVPRSGQVGVAVTTKGSAYNEEQPVDDEVTLRARKFTALLRIAEEDIADLPASGVANYVRAKQLDWASSYGRALDNAALATTGAENGTTVPFTSVYAAVAAGAAGNRITSGAGGAVTYDNLSDTFGAVEGGDFYDPADMVAIAHPAFLGTLRGVTDSNNRPIFEGNGQGGQATLFGLQLRFSLGARTNATMSQAPTGNPLLIIGPRSLLVLGVRSGPEYAVISGWDGASAVTDEALVKMRSRRGFAVGQASAFSILELAPAV